jgi:hypothetical protein
LRDKELASMRVHVEEEDSAEKVERFTDGCNRTEKSE